MKIPIKERVFGTLVAPGKDLSGYLLRCVNASHAPCRREEKNYSKWAEGRLKELFLALESPGKLVKFTEVNA